MTSNLKALGLALVAVFALGAIGAQGALAVVDHEFHSDGEKTVITGTNVGVHTFQVGAAGTFQCTTTTIEGTQKGTLESANTYKTDTLTVVPKFSNCTFGGQPATVFFNHCAYVLDSETTEGNPTTPPIEHANVEIECSEGSKIQIHTVNCTITIGPQLLKHAIRYENELSVPSAERFITTAHNVVVGKERNTAAQPANGCLLFPTGAVGKLAGTTTVKCFRDDNVAEPSGTEKTTPPTATEGPTTDCSVKGAPTV